MCEICKALMISEEGCDPLDSAGMYEMHLFTEGKSGFEGRRHTPETRALMSAAHKGRPVPEYRKQLIRETLKGRAPPNKGKKCPKMSEAAKKMWLTRSRYVSPETRELLREKAKKQWERKRGVFGDL